MTLRPIAIALALVAGCAQPVLSEPGGDPADECALCEGKADGWGAPAEGSCEAEAMVRLANEASFDELDIEAGLNRRAVENLFAARPFGSLREVDDVSYVGVVALSLMRDYARERGLTEACADVSEMGIVSDLDKTVIPPEDDYALPPAPYPGVATLYRILEHGADGEGAPGDTTYVTARSPDMIAEVPEWLAEHDLPEGPIETGTADFWDAQAEKVRDISRVLDATSSQPFILFGDSSHRDPEVYSEIRELYPDRIRAGVIHRVTATVSPHRVEGLHLVEHYPHAAAVLVGLGVLTEADAWTVYEAAVAEGLVLEEADFRALLP